MDARIEVEAHALEITFESDVVNGDEWESVEFVLPAKSTACESCDGTGTHTRQGAACPACGGVGSVLVVDRDEACPGALARYDVFLRETSADRRGR